MPGDGAVPGQTPLPDRSGLRDPSVRTVGELNALEAENVRRAVVRSRMLGSIWLRLHERYTSRSP